MIKAKALNKCWGIWAGVLLMHLEYLNVFLFFLITAILVLFAVWVKKFPHPSFEEEGQIRYPIRFFLIALIVLLFDLGIVLVLPTTAVLIKWVKQAGFFGWIALLEILFFVGLLVVAFIYVWKKGDIDWASPRERFISS
ncbi:NADH-quinone oxidoreductase subunit A [Bdellovibrionota bacterium]